MTNPYFQDSVLDWIERLLHPGRRLSDMGDRRPVITSADLRQVPDALRQTGFPSGPDFAPRVIPSIGPAPSSHVQAINQRYTNDLINQGAGLAQAGGASRALLEAARTLGEPTEAAYRGLMGQPSGGYQRMEELRAAGLDPTTDIERVVGGLAGSAPMYAGAGKLFAKPLAEALFAPGALRGATQTALTLGGGTAPQATASAMAHGQKFAPALEEGVAQGMMAGLPTNPINAALLFAGGLGGLGKAVPGTGHLRPEPYQPRWMRELGDMEAPAFDRRRGLDAVRARLATQASERDLMANQQFNQGYSPQAGSVGLRTLAPLAGAGVGAAAGALADPEHRGQGALMGGLAGLAVGHGVGRFTKPTIPTRVSPATAIGTERLEAARINLHPGEPPTSGSGTIDPLNLARFGMDPTGDLRLRATEQALYQSGKIQPHETVPWEQTRLEARAAGVDVTGLPGRQVGPQVRGRLLAAGQIVRENTDAIGRLNDQLKSLGDWTPEGQGVMRQIGILETQNVHLLKVLVPDMSEAGRVLNSFKIQLQRSLDPTYWKSVATRIVGPEHFTTEMETHLNRLLNDGDKPGIIRFLQEARNPSTGETLLSGWKAGLLWNPATHVGNFASNMTLAALETAKDPVAAGADWLMSLRTGQRTKSVASNLGFGDFPEGLRRGWDEAKRILQGETMPDSFGKYDLRANADYGSPIKNAFILGPFRFLEAGDRIAKGVALERSLAERARVAGLNEHLRGEKLTARIQEVVDALHGKEPPTPIPGIDKMYADAIGDALVATVQDRTMVGKALRSLQGIPVIGQLAIPFSRTPGAYLTRVFEYSPFSVPSTVYKTIKVLTGHDVSPELQRQAAEGWGRTLTGSGVIWLGYKLAGSGINLLGHQLAQPGTLGQTLMFGSAEQRVGRETGDLSGGVHMGDMVARTSRMGPIANLLVTGANLYHMIQDTPNAGLGKRIQQIGVGALRTVGDQPFVTGLRQISKTYEGLAAGGDQTGMVEDLAGSIVPSPVRAIARGTDPFERAPKGIVQSFMAGVPGLREQLPPQRLGLGAERPSGVASDNIPLDVFLALFDPFSIRADRAKRDPSGTLALLRRVGWAPSPPPRRPGEPEMDYQDRAIRAGEAAFTAIHTGVQTDAWALMEQDEASSSRDTRALTVIHGDMADYLSALVSTARSQATRSFRRP